MSTIRLSFVGLAARVVILLLTLAASVIIARGIGPSGMGVYFLVITAANLIATFADVGLSSSAVVFSGDRAHRLSEIGLILLVAAVAIGIPLGVGLHFFFPKQALWGSSALGVVAAILITPMVLYNNYWTAMLVGRREIIVANAYQCSTYLTFTAVLIVLRLVGRITVENVIATHIVVFGGQMLAQAIFIHGRAEDNPPPHSPSRFALAVQMARFGLPVYPSTVATVFTLRIGIVMLTAYHGTFANGIYSVAFQLADKLQLIARSIQDAIYENVIRLKGRDAIDALNRYLRAAMVVLGAIAVVGVIVAPIAIRVLFGKQFLSSTRPLQFLTIGSALYGMATLISTYFVGQIRRTAVLSWIACIAVGITLLANWLLIPPLGADGAALALLMTQAAVFMMSMAMYRKSAASDLKSMLVLSRDDARQLLRRLRTLFSGDRVVGT